ncbi:protein of unknown function [Candidatus Filomicrobium marinum]|uniref:Uncharacterized protein n=2 Tax=Filomicrobium TaxID=119044 RepID=A0A0D6JJ40_9HYPH|nr:MULTISPECIES: hypothetical protein [Filomicrobium]CFX31861.1 protein of unknown function [Candidatus Filomicrobium marinum]CPR21999.1 protein of unknown function [Candidatus Filomicrobium marinum]SDP46529.1 hypothetical protein SAMN04488061_3082 [Filomicrobium insigne]
MTSEQNRQRDMERLRYLLEVYGGDRDRWPARERLSVAAFLAEDAAAQRLLREACVLDDVIMNCQLPSGRSDSMRLNDLGDRIMARALAEKRQAASFRQTLPNVRSYQSVRARLWQAATLMAACLVTGIMVGQSGLVASPVEQTSEVSSLDEETFTTSLADDGFVIFAEEDKI